MWRRVFLLGVCLFSALAAAEPSLRRHNSRPLNAEGDIASFDPWETPIEGFFVRSHHEMPVVDPERWVLVVDGLVDKPLTLTLKDLRAFGEKSLHAVLECSGNGRALHSPSVPGVQWERGALGNAEWTGVSLADVLAKAGVQAKAKFARLEGADKPALPTTPPFVRSVPIAKLLEKDTLLALKMNREPLPPLHGGPLRLVLPRWYGENWMKWLTHITLTETEDTGFYMAKAYRLPKTPVKPGEKWDSATGIPIETLKVQTLIVSPRPDEAVGSDGFRVAGKAFSGEGNIRKVEISLDGGKHWRSAELEAAHADGGWQEFSLDVKGAKLGKLKILARATDAAGNVQPLGRTWNPGGYVRNWADEVTVAVVPQAPGVGENLLNDRCLTCHAGELIASQRLSAEAWDKEVTKMQGFGARLSSEEHRQLVKYLAQWSPKVTPGKPERTDFHHEADIANTLEEADGDPLRGAQLFTQHCANCHGKDGEGGVGPRLKGRMVTRIAFFSAVLHGRRVMPGFDKTLRPQQIADLRAYVNQPVNVPNE